MEVLTADAYRFYMFFNEYADNLLKITNGKVVQ